MNKLNTFLSLTRNDRVPWSSGYGRRLMLKGCEFESRHRILDGHFSHIFVVKIVMLVLKAENRWPIFLKKTAKRHRMTQPFANILLQSISNLSKFEPQNFSTKRHDWHGQRLGIVRKVSLGRYFLFSPCGCRTQYIVKMCVDRFYHFIF